MKTLNSPTYCFSTAERVIWNKKQKNHQLKLKLYKIHQSKQSHREHNKKTDNTFRDQTQHSLSRFCWTTNIAFNSIQRPEQTIPGFFISTHVAKRRRKESPQPEWYSQLFYDWAQKSRKGLQNPFSLSTNIPNILELKVYHPGSSVLEQAYFFQNSIWTLS